MCVPVFFRAGARPLAEVKEKGTTFVGTGFRLGESEGPSRAVGSPTQQPLKVRWWACVCRRG